MRKYVEDGYASIDWRIRILNQHLANIEVFDNGERITITTLEGTALRLRAEGDCCSRSWVECIDNLSLGIGKRIINVVGKFGGETDEEDYAVLKFYAVELVTEGGVVVIDFRNSSNGYYGGSLEAMDEVDEDE